MADKEHLTHLRQGEAHWNTWRAEQPVDLRPDLSGANLSRAVVFRTIFSDLDLRNVRGLDTLVHTGPSTIGTDTLVRSQGDLPEGFLFGGTPISTSERSRSSSRACCPHS